MTSQIPAALATYMTTVGIEMTSQAMWPTVAAVFYPDRGWQSQRAWRKRITPSWARKLRAQGVTVIALTCPGHRSIDFQIKELAR